MCYNIRLLTSNFSTNILTTICSKSLDAQSLVSLHYFLGIHVQSLPSGLHLSQSKYIFDLLDHAKLIDVKPAKTPIPTISKLSQHNGDPLQNPSKYGHLVRALQYCTLTKPDIAFAVNQLCQFMHSPTTAH